MEAPDVLQLGDKLVVLGCFPGPKGCYSCGTAHWWVGTTLSADDLTFAPELTGRFDYGLPGFSSMYASKSGSSAIATPFTRRLHFAFGGWREADLSMTRGCGGWYALPRELYVSAGATGGGGESGGGALLLQHPATELKGLSPHGCDNDHRPQSCGRWPG